MMKTNLKIILIVLSILLLVPISIFAFSNIFDKIVPTDIVGSEKENLLEEKSAYSNSTYDTYLASNFSTSIDSELQNRLDAIAIEQEAFNNKLSSIINKFYPDEFATIQEELENTDKISHDGNLSENSPEIKLYSLILEIIENKDLTSEERTTLKEFLDSQISNIKNNEALVARIQNVCNN